MGKKAQNRKPNLKEPHPKRGRFARHTSDDVDPIRFKGHHNDAYPATSPVLPASPGQPQQINRLPELALDKVTSYLRYRDFCALRTVDWRTGTQYDEYKIWVNEFCTAVTHGKFEQVKQMLAQAEAIYNFCRIPSEKTLLFALLNHLPTCAMYEGTSHRPEGSALEIAMTRGNTEIVTLLRDSFGVLDDGARKFEVIRQRIMQKALEDIAYYERLQQKQFEAGSDPIKHIEFVPGPNFQNDSWDCTLRETTIDALAADSPVLSAQSTIAANTGVTAVCGPTANTAAPADLLAPEDEVQATLQRLYRIQAQFAIDYQAIIDAISNASEQEVKDALALKDTHSPLSQAIKKWRATLDYHNAHTHFHNLHHWYQSRLRYEWLFEAKPDWTADQYALFWRQIHGGTQAASPCARKQDFARGIDNINRGGERRHTMAFLHDGNKIAEEDGTVVAGGLGNNFAAMRAGGGVEERLGGVGLTSFEWGVASVFLLNNTSKLVSGLAPLASSLLARPGPANG